MEKLRLPIYDLTGKTTGDFELDGAVFGVTPNVTLLHQAVVSYLANRRAATAHTKDRGEVAGSNKKPWRQKGTGNARAGSTRSPLWRGGGVTFGPSNERNYTVRMPQKMRQAAMKAALSSKVAGESFIIVDSLEALDGKTKSWVNAAATLPIKGKGMLVVSAAKVDAADRAIRNVPKHKYVGITGLTTYDIMRAPVVVMTKDAVTSITERLSAKGAQVVAPAKAGN